jgi:RNA polymerase sigma-70 factor (ECF subfamily)
MAAEHDEREWIRQSREGQAEAFALLIHEYQRMIHSLTYRMTGSLTEAEDLAQETFVRAWQHLDSFKGNSKFSTWLCRIAMNTCLNWRQREGRRSEIHQTLANDALTNGSPHKADPATSELNRRVQIALDRLPAKQRAAIVLTVYQELSHAEAARALNCTEATVSWRVFAARNKLKRWLKAEISHE